MRVLPRLHEDVNEEWISDKTRFACDGLRRQRLDRCYVRDDAGTLQPADWDDAFTAIRDRLQGVPGERMAAIAGDLADCESQFALLSLMQSLGSPHTDCRQDGAMLDPAAPVGRRFNTTIAGIEDADALLLIGTNPRREAAVLNARIRKRFLRGGFPIAVIGEEADLSYPFTLIDGGPAGLEALLDGSHAFAEILKAAQRPMLIIGQGALARADGARVLGAARRIAEAFGMVVAPEGESAGWNGFNVLHTAAGRMGGLELGFLPDKGGLDVAGILSGAADGKIEVVYLLGADEIDTTRLGNAFVIYQGHHGDRGAHRADVILPGAAYTEKGATYINTEGRVQRALRAVFPRGDAREDWTIVRALSERLGRTLPFNSLLELRQQIARRHSWFAETDAIRPLAWQPFGQAGAMDGRSFTSPIVNFYMTDPISRTSAVMAACTEAMSGPASRTGTHG